MIGNFILKRLLLADEAKSVRWVGEMCTGAGDDHDYKYNNHDAKVERPSQKAPLLSCFKYSVVVV